jgi:hypothetical protein
MARENYPILGGIVGSFIWGVLLTLYAMFLTSILAAAAPTIWIPLSLALALPTVLTLATGFLVIDLVRFYLIKSYYKPLYDWTKLS